MHVVQKPIFLTIVKSMNDGYDNEMNLYAISFENQLCQGSSWLPVKIRSQISCNIGDNYGLIIKNEWCIMLG